MAIGEFVDFESYKEHHGEMTQMQFNAVIKEGYTEDEYGQIFHDIVQLGYGLPDAAQADALARIHKVFPNKMLLWKLAESYLILGRY